MAAAWQFIGRIRAMRGEQEAAAAHQMRALRLSPFDPSNYGAFAALAYAHLSFGHYAEAAD